MPPSRPLKPRLPIGMPFKPNPVPPMAQPQVLNDGDLEKLGIYRGWPEGSPGAKAASAGGPLGPLGGYWDKGQWVPLKSQQQPRTSLRGV